MLWSQDQSHPKHRVTGNSPEVAVASFPISSPPDTMGSSNIAGLSPWLSPATGVVRAMTPTTSGVGLMTQVTLRSCGHIVGQETAFPLVVANLDWVSSLTGATIWQAQCGATDPGSTTIISVLGQSKKRDHSPSTTTS